jgi:hypothetical protein
MDRKFNESDLKKIRELKNRLSYKRVAALFDVSPHTIWRIIKGYSYKQPIKRRYLPVNPLEIKKITVPTKRVYELEVGDIFLYAGVDRIVDKITDERVCYKPNTQYQQGSGKSTFGIKNQMKVEFLGKAPKGRLRPERIKQVTL